MKRNNFGAIIISAGYSSRMGDFKPLLKFGKYTAVELLINTFTSSGINNIVVVVGYRGNEILELLKNSKIKCVENRDYPKGMYSSIVTALGALDDTVDGFFMIPVDIPLVKTNTINSLENEYLKGNAGIIYPVFNEKKGHPPLIDCKYKNIIKKWSGGGGLKKLLAKFEKDSTMVAVCDNSILMDMDTKDEYCKLVDYFNSQIPNIEECLCILKLYNVPLDVIEHSVKVSQVAMDICESLNDAGYNFDKDILKTAGLLHDVSRNCKNHAEAGGKLLKKLGYPKLGNIISHHMNIKVSSQENIKESEILYLSDKLVKKDKIINLKARREYCLNKYRDNQEALYKINLRFDAAEDIMEKLKCAIGRVFKYE